ncbi:tetratricopeptide repeat protein [Lentzea sp. BCCO 10_0856]|uniref:Tetratricopeptide repeat protein n=1 Tax=Lentzea miocenica TaxID=3095431 RepID=A0ABU4TB15_9PSEU|nr:tetratricopeptide repeat protein [Lentzea sp. BCCO 10_0856]MDX8035290.1 tetratricopeptide repeat protein [Lentzea sp. BCCO 10_0856]
MTWRGTENDNFYIGREEERAVLGVVDEVRRDGTSRAVLLYGPGGVGKTRLVRELADRGHDGVVWMAPIDVDDSEYWLLTNLEHDIAVKLDPGHDFFEPYFHQAASFEDVTRQRIGLETIKGHLERLNETFVECYRAFVAASGTTVVITLDTVEAVRGMSSFLVKLTQWMKELPSTAFVLSGRPVRDDPLQVQLGGVHRPLETTVLELGGFTGAEVEAYFDAGPLRGSLTAAERDRLAELTEGHPLWLALAVAYLVHQDPPREMTEEGEINAKRRDLFRRRLITPFRDTGFWPEAIKRLAVVRHSVNQTIWQQLMSDRDLPADAESWPHAWEQLLARPWVRPRANQRYVTLHDALAEELAQRLIPLEDRDETWRTALWQHAVTAYSALHQEKSAEQQHTLDTLPVIMAALPSTGDEALRELAQLPADKRELDQIRTAELHYRLLLSFEDGTDRFVALHREAQQDNDLLFEELICHELERFLPHARFTAPLDDVLGVVVRRFQRWLADEAPVRYLEMTLIIASFLTHNEQPAAAMELMQDVPLQGAGPEMRYRLANERGNACMRIPNRIAEAKGFFQEAQRQAQQLPLPAQARRVAQANKELGFFYRNIGQWQDADNAYSQARDTLASVLGPGSTDEAREEMASIQTNWAYLKALRGLYVEARNLVESAVQVRKRLGNRINVGISLSVCGEVHRYERNFLEAWQDYREAETIFQEHGSWAWLGQIYQEQAICLLQAHQAGVDLVEDPLERARSLIERSLEICRDRAIRGYPSALNRAGRIFGVTDVDKGLDYLKQSIVAANRIADGWFLSANIIEYVELAYQAWNQTEDQAYRDDLDALTGDVAEAIERYRFIDLRGRWELMCGHLAATDALADDDPEGLDQAVLHYGKGFTLLADRRVGSHGAAAISTEFVRFQRVYDKLPHDVKIEWYTVLRRMWTAENEQRQYTSLLARLEQLY